MLNCWIKVRLTKNTLIVRSGGRGQTTALCMEARFLADRLAASSRTDPNLRARSIMSLFSKSQGRESRRRSKERSRSEAEESESPKNESRRQSKLSIPDLEILELGLGSGEVEGEQQGRLSLGLGEEAMEGQWRRRVSISSDGGGETERGRA